MKAPGPDHPITIVQNPRRVRIRFGGRIIADTARALTLVEAHYTPVQYIPRTDVDMTLLRRTTHHTNCPYKGEASYFTLSDGEQTAENAAWSYEQPYPAVSAIKDYVAFYPDRVDAIEEE